MSTSRQTPPTNRKTLGTYTRDGTHHTVVASRDPDGPWQLLDIAGENTTVIETLYPGEGEQQARTVADLYLQEMRP